MTEDDQRKINQLVGEAMISLVQSGANPDAVGAFALTYPSKVASILGLAPAAPEPDLQDLVIHTVQESMRAEFPALLKDALTAAGVGTDGRRKRVNVLIRGARTSVTIRPDLMANLKEAKGASKREVAKTLNELARSMPEDTDNKSQWLEAKLEWYLQN